jgi:alkanesulfonate monooxygenase SsuD/methylene tetrahydromethanopterin reductase-like flavin-dependent oxidoreductase (luciferase family)
VRRADQEKAWNIVTSFSKSSARVFGKDDLPSHDERYAAAEEYMDIVYQLWEKSWEDDVQKWQAEVRFALPSVPSQPHMAELEA